MEQAARFEIAVDATCVGENAVDGIAVEHGRREVGELSRQRCLELLREPRGVCLAGALISHG